MVAALDGTFYRFFDLFKDWDSFSIGQIGKVIATAIIVLDGARRELSIPKNKRKNG